MRAVRNWLCVLLCAGGCGRIDFGALDGALDARGDGLLGTDTSPPAAGLVAWYPLEEGTGLQTTDASGTGNDAYTDTCGVPSPAWVPGRIGTAMHFASAPQNCLDTDESPTLIQAGAWTVATWVQLDAAPAAGEAFALVLKPNGASQHNYALFADRGLIGPGTETWLVTFHDAASIRHFTAMPATFTTGEWHHVAGTWNGTTLAIYLDGAPGATTTPGAVPAATTYNTATGMDIAARDQCCGHYLDGALDDIRIYNRALAPPEIAALYNVP